MRLSLPPPVLHIYRGLLREATYLPPLCQPYIAEQIRNRFHRRRYDDPHAPETKHRIRKARHDLRYLWAANNGLLGNMHHVLLLVFGRTGKRRSELLRDIVRKEPPVDSDELEIALNKEREARTYTAKDGTRKERAPDWLDKWDTQKIRAFAVSQSRTGPPLSPRPAMKAKQTIPEKRLPEEDVWGRPLAARLARGKLRREYKALVHRIEPPVPRSEWEMLRDLATGQADKSLWEMPLRRPRAISPQGDHGDGDKTEEWDWYAYATEPVRSIERNQSRSQRGRTGAKVDGPYGKGTSIGVHTYTPRLWRRLYAKIWEMTPMVAEKPGQDGKPVYIWGKTHKGIPVATAEYAKFFEGAPEVSMTSRKKRRR